jgi:hypothetical protein
MKKRTRQLAQAVREALLALPDVLLMETLDEWFERAESQLVCLEWADDYKYGLGYRVQSDDTEKIYATIDEYCEVEPDGSSFSWLVPDVETLRANLTVEQVYHTIVQLAGEALREQRYEQGWEMPPSTGSDGYDFMRCLTVYLRAIALPKLEYGHPVFSIFPGVATGRRKPMHSTSKAIPVFVTRRYGSAEGA